MKKRITIISIIVIILLAALIILGLYLKTDIFKSNEEMFWKYLGKNMSATDLLKFEDELKDQAYNSRIGLIVKAQGTLPENTKLDNLSINIERNGTSDGKKKITSINAYMPDDSELVSIQLFKENDLYAFQSKEIANGYIGIENSSLKEFVQGLEIEGISDMPNKIVVSNYNELFELSKEEQKYIIDTYKPIIQKNINKKKYIKNKGIKTEVGDTQYSATTYTLALSEKEFNQLEISMLEKLVQDSRTLNLISTKLKIMNLPEEYTSINNINEKITNIIEELKQKQCTDEEYLKIRVYINEGKVIRTDITIQQNEYVIEYNNEENHIKIKINPSDKQDDGSIKEIYLQNYKDSQSKQYEFKMSTSKQDILRIKTDQTNKEGGYSKTINISANINDANYTISGQEETNIGRYEDVINLQELSGVVINKLNPEQSKRIIESIKNRILKIYEEKSEKLLTL